MATRSYEEVRRSLDRAEIQPVYYLYGPEEVLKGEIAAGIVERALDPGTRDFNLEQHLASQLDPEALETSLHSLPMMAARRVVILRDIESLKAKTRVILQRYLERPIADTVLILQQGPGEEASDSALAGSTLAVSCSPLPPDQVVEWLVERARRLGVSFEDGAAEHLAKATGHDLGTIDSELTKLSALPDQGPITIERVGQLVGVRRGETLYDWRDAVLGGQTVEALELTDVVLGQTGVTPVRMATVIGSSLVGVSLARGHYDRGKQGPALVSELTATLTRRLRPYWLKDIGWSVEAGRWAGWAAAWAPSGISRAIASVLAADQALKNTRVSEERSILLDLILQLDQVRREAA